MTTDGDMTLDQIEQTVRARIAACDARVAELRQQRTAMQAEINRLLEERQRAMRLLPRQSRQPRQQESPAAEG